MRYLTEERRAKLQAWVPASRAALVAALIIGNLSMAMPYRGLAWAGVSDPAYGRKDFELWWGWFGDWSPLPRPAVDWLFRRWAWSQDNLVGLVRVPFEPVADFLNVNQRWTLFAAVTRAPRRLVVEVRRDGEWEVLYRRLDPEHTWHDAQLRYRRVRGVWDSADIEDPKGTYKRMAKWIALTAFTEHADVDRVRVILERSHLMPPWEPLDAEVTRHAERYYRRHEVLP